MLKKNFDSLEIDVASRFKALRVTNALDGSEDGSGSFRNSNCISRKQNEDISQLRNEKQKSERFKRFNETNNATNEDKKKEFK